ncbi:VWA domain-containing protein [Nakamurella leprariae]|uniref:Mg-protoporphyrin IX chelatase n=1 Tax=Nakamurella leprariae TaxID=2803911 RepID=A0A939C2D1_9ACTN|nr:VWA domain-containing protein [Nakamurella leprariae]
MALALVLTSVSPAVGGVLVRGEKGTAKSTMVRALAALLPPVAVATGCRFSCDPADPDPSCPDGPHPAGVTAGDLAVRPARLVELPVGATEDRVIGSLHLERALSSGVTEYEPGLLAAAHRGLLYVDEVNLLHDHLVDLLLDAAAMGRSTVEREGVSVAHAARFVLVGTMNPEEGELRPQLLDRFGLTVEIGAPRDPLVRAEVVRRRLAFDADPAVFRAEYADAETALAARIARAQALVPRVQLSDAALAAIARVCAGFEVDGMRADIVTARAAVAHAAWHGRNRVVRADIRAAARLSLPHRRRRNPFDAPGLDEELLDRLLGDDEPDPEPGPESAPDPGDDGGERQERGRADDRSQPTPADGAADRPDTADGHGPEPSGRTDAETPTGETSHDGGDPAADADRPTGAAGAAPSGTVAAPQQPYRPRLFTVRGVGAGAAGRRSPALTSTGRTIGATRPTGSGVGSALHLPATLRAAAPHQVARGRTAAPSSDGPGSRMHLRPADLRLAVRQGRESNLVLLCVDASGSMAARTRMEQVKTAVLSLLLDAYQRRDKVGLVTFRGKGATVALPPTSSVDAAARRLTDLPAGGRTPLAEGLLTAAEVLRIERLRDPRRRPLLVLVTDGRATAGPDALARSRQAAGWLATQDISTLVLDCEVGRFRMGLAADLAGLLQAEYLPVGELAAPTLTAAITDATAAVRADAGPARGRVA